MRKATCSVTRTAEYAMETNHYTHVQSQVNCVTFRGIQKAFAGKLYVLSSMIDGLVCGRSYGNTNVEEIKGKIL